jgi:hypothetical protein
LLGYIKKQGMKNRFHANTGLLEQLKASSALAGKDGSLYKCLTSIQLSKLIPL